MTHDLTLEQWGYSVVLVCSCQERERSDTGGRVSVQRWEGPVPLTTLNAAADAHTAEAGQ